MTKRIAFLLFLGLLIGLPAAARAEEERKSPLADAPAIRKRLELRENRFEIGVGAGSTVGQSFYHAILLGPKLAFHLTDWLAISGNMGFNVSPKFKTAFHDQLTTTLTGPAPTDRTPTLADAEAGMNHIGQIYALQAELIPFSGKWSLFSKIFMSYDFYGFAGMGAINFAADGMHGVYRYHREKSEYSPLQSDSRPRFQ